MRFTGEKQLMEAYFNNTKITKTKYLWWPLTIDGETRWLEIATIEYRVKRSEDIFCNRYHYWSPWSWINK